MKKIGLAIAVALSLAASSPALAALKVDVNQGNIQPLPIAILDFVAASPGDVATSQNIARVVRADLDRSGLFKPLDSKSFIDKVTNINVAPNFANWRIITAQGLVTGQVAMQTDGRLRVDFMAQRGKCGGSEVKEMGHGEGVIAHAAMGEQRFAQLRELLIELNAVVAREAP